MKRKEYQESHSDYDYLNRIPAEFIIQISEDINGYGLLNLRKKNKEWIYITSGGNEIHATISDKGNGIDFWHNNP
jgi:hypothetical protein